MRWNKASKTISLMLLILATLTALLFTGCSSIINADGREQTSEDIEKANDVKENSPSKKILNKTGETIKTRYQVPEGYERMALEGKSFGLFVRDQKLMPYDETHCAEGIYDSVLDIAIDPENIHQSSAMMLMRAEYLYSHERYDEIVFTFESGFVAEYEKWVKGNRLDKQGGLTQWVPRGNTSNKPEDLQAFMEAVFKYSGGLSIEKNLVPVDLEDMAIGDIFVRGGGVAQIVMIIDMAVNPTTGEKIFMLAQSSIVTKETRILLNPYNLEISPWYSQDMDEGLSTPEGKFVKSDLKGFE